MNDNNTRDYTGLSASELAFQLDSANWKYGPTFNVRFFFDHPLDFSDFEASLLNDRLCISEPKLNTPGRVLLRHDHFPGCIGARYYDFQRPDRREPTLVFYPRQYRRFLCGQRFSNAPKGAIGQLLHPIIDLSKRVKAGCCANEVLMFLDDFYPGKTPETEISEGVFLAEPIFEALK